MFSIPSSLHKLVSSVTRKKSMLTEDVLETNLRRCLSTLDVTLLALGYTVGSGIYVLTATVAKNKAGPGILLAFIFSGISALLSSLSYAELGVKYPKCGSAYSYTYLSLGELLAFLVGWNMALENIIGAASAAKACSAYIDSLVGGVVRNYTDTYIGTFHVAFFAEHFDFLALAIVTVFVAYLSFGVKMTSYLTNFFTIVNMLVIAIFIGVGGYYSDISNWTNEEAGGFLPYGWSGVLAASASCFYAFVGFEVVAQAGEETTDPQKSIPKATFITMTIATVAYVAASSVLTLMVDYRDIVEDSGMPEALAYHGAYWAQMVVTVGALFGIFPGIIGCLFGLTRIIYIMSDDGLLFPFCSKVSARTKIPLRAMYLFSAFAAILAFMLDLDTLVELFSIGTLFAYLNVSASVIILRYRPQEGMVSCEIPNVTSKELAVVKETKLMVTINKKDVAAFTISENDNELAADTGMKLAKRSEAGLATINEGKLATIDETEPDTSTDIKLYSGSKRRLSEIDNGGRLKEEFRWLSSHIRLSPGLLVTSSVLLFIVISFIFSVFAKIFFAEIIEGHWWAVTVATLNLLVLLLSVGVILLHQQSTAHMRYKMPLVPLLPLASIFLNVVFMVNLQSGTWIRLLIWIVVGLFLYFSYGLKHSKQGDAARTFSEPTLKTTMASIATDNTDL